MTGPVPPAPDAGEDAAEAARLAELRRYRILDTPPEAAFDRVTRLAARLLRAPIALVSLVGPERQWFKSRLGLDVCGTSRDVSLCAHALGGEGPLVVPDARLDPRFAANPLVAGAPGIRLYAGAPLVTPRGHALGTLCVIDTAPRPGGLSQGELATLAELAALVVDRLELRRAKLSLRAAKEAAEASARAKADFLAVMGHELRTPLTAVLGYADLLLADAAPGSAAAGYARAVRAGGRELLGHVEAVLAYVEGSVGAAPLAEAEVDLGGLVGERVAAASAAASARGMTVSLRRAPAAVRVGADARVIGHAVAALLANAIRHGRPGGRVAVGLARGPAAAGVLVRDDGPGIPPEVLRGLPGGGGATFPDGRGDPARAGGGLGLGLALARRAAELHGGTLRLRSAPGRGTAAVLRLPAHRRWAPAAALGGA